MKYFQCGKCDQILEEKHVSKHPDSEITWVSVKQARDHDREEKIDQMQNKSRRSEEHEKEKKIEAYKAELRDLDDDEMDELLESLRAELHELKKKLNPETGAESKMSKSAMAEFIGTDNNYHSVSIDGDIETESLVALQSHRHRQKKLKHSQSYSVLTLDQGHNTAPGDKLLYLLGSRDDDSVDDSSGDELLKSLGSTD